MTRKIGGILICRYDSDNSVKTEACKIFERKRFCRRSLSSVFSITSVIAKNEGLTKTYK